MDDELITKTLAIVNGTSNPISSFDLAKQLDIERGRAEGLIRSIEIQAPGFLNIKKSSYKELKLTQEGEVVLKHGSHEARIFRTVLESQPNGIDQASLLQCLGDVSKDSAKSGFNNAMKNGWILIDKETKKIKPKVETIEDQLLKSIEKISLSPKEKVDGKVLTDCKKRKLVEEREINFLELTKGPDFQLTFSRPATDLTTEMLQSGDWAKQTFKDYNFSALGLPAERGHLHPLLKVREQFRQIFLEMGFSEMPTNNFVESSFWNFDTLVVPQAHPARDSQDTFFVDLPVTSKPIEDRKLVDRVRHAHQGSKDGSWPKGYQYEWSEPESSRNVLRTHTTAVTARMLYKLAEEHKQSGSNKFKPAKLFSIDRVFRNETLDATHLAEFNQVEGVVVDEGLTLGDLMGVLNAFFEKLGITQLRFKPAYNPYTEPSMEIFSYHPGLSKWVEVGNSGVFRPEMLSALGLPETVTAIAWGLSLERPTMIKYKFDNIRELVGYKVNIKMVQESPLCLF